MLPGRPRSTAQYLLRAGIAVALILAFAGWMISRSTGALHSNPSIYADIPVRVGLINASAPVRFHGVKVGTIARIDAGTESSRVTIELDENAIGTIPSTVLLRVAPRTFFGDIYLQLLTPENNKAANPPALSDGDSVRVDDGPDAVNLYSIFTQLNDLLTEVQPAKLNVALAAVNRSLGDDGARLGSMIDDWWVASRELESSVNEFLEATPKFRAVMESLRRAAPSIVATMASATEISTAIVENRDNLAAFLTSASGFASSVGKFVSTQRQNLITVITSTATITSTVADNPAGLSRTLSEADKFGAAGTKLFASGRFNITAVPTFSQPMPYTAANCPRYGSLRGSDCFGWGNGVGTGPVRKPGQPNSSILAPTNPTKPAQKSATAQPSSFTTAPPVIDGTAEIPAMTALENNIPGATRKPGQAPSALTSVMVGPMVRGTTVSVS